MCHQCEIIDTLFVVANQDVIHNYEPVLKFLEVLVKQKRLEMVAGDCLLNDAIEILESEQHFTVCHYLKCSTCGHIYFIGACIRGIPVFKRMEDINENEWKKIIWGNMGTYFN